MQGTKSQYKYRTALWIFYALIIAGVAVLVVLHGFVVHQAKKEYPLQKADCAIVLGALANQDGSMSDVQRVRAEKAAELYHQELVTCIIVTGGIGHEQQRPEAEIMKEYLVHLDVDEADILMDTMALDTRQNMIHAKVIMAANGYESAAVVTSDFHLYRALAIAEEEGIQASGVPCEAGGNREYQELREIWSLIRYWIFSK